MKLYKIDFTNTIGDYMVTVPTDSQFLIGISNGDSEADVELLDGETEITPEDEKIGAYTVFNFETDGTPFRKHLKANINGQKPATKYWDAHEYDITDSTKTATMAILDDDVFPGYEDNHPVPPTATTMSTTLVYTYNSVATAGGYPCSIWDAPTEIDEEITNAFPVPLKIRMKLGVVWGWNKIEPNYTGQTSSVNWKATPLVADIQIPYEGYDPYTDKLNIVVKCDKMSVAYRDFEGSINGATCKSLVMQNADGDVVIDIDGTNFMDVERTIVEIGTTDAQVASNTITANIDLDDFPVEEGLTPMFKLNLKINCLGDAVTLPDGLMLINITDGEETSTLSTSDFYVSYISGPTSLATVIGDSSGTSLLVELVFDADGGYAFIKGASYIE